MPRLAAICWGIWKTRNRVVFEHKMIIKHSLEIICSACAIMHYLAGLYPDSMKEIIVAGIDLMIQVALKILGRQGRCYQAGALKATPYDEPESSRLERQSRIHKMRSKKGGCQGSELLGWRTG